jgi:predicted kinase
MKNTVIFTIGIPASGKSTWCEYFLSQNKNFVRVSRDDLRKMFRNESMPSSHLEQMVTDLVTKISIESLNRGYGVLLDATHIKIIYIERIRTRLLISNKDLKFKIKMFDTPLEVCLQRNEIRDRSVPVEVIVKMSNSLKNLDLKILNDRGLELI